MSKNHLKSPPALSFSGALSATLQDHLQKSCVECAFPEHARPLPRVNILTDNLFRTIVGHLMSNRLTLPQSIMAKEYGRNNH